MDILYTRVSTLIQNNDRQLLHKKDYNLIIEDKCSGTIPFFERDGGKKILKLLNNNSITSLNVHQIDRLGRNLIDILNTIAIFNQKKVNINFLQQGLKTLDEDSKENAISKMIISILGVVAEMERNLIRERQLEGIAIAKAKGVYDGRRKGTSESGLTFLNKKKNKKAVKLLEEGYKQSEVAKIIGLHPNTVSKIKKINNKLKNII
ncbi:recombinase family protein [Lutibacter sp.]|uniref:recombinase family protein n=1 Tax=Lutibacter sp. TaxID=1925666 RepID=UPI0025BD328C|nr:recombinase family protein [Lutibacter sp.]MCF6180502.1 recombinase family protein [Lutibacter sp.]